MTKILAIDPGPQDSAGVIWDTEKEIIVEKWHQLNVKILPGLMSFKIGDQGVEIIAIEDPQAQRRPASNDFINTVQWSARFYQALYQNLYGEKYDALQLIPYSAISSHFCGIANAKEKFVKEELLKRYGPQGSKSKQGKLYGISGHCWSALAVSVYVADNLGKLVIPMTPAVGAILFDNDRI